MNIKLKTLFSTTILIVLSVQLLSIKGVTSQTTSTYHPNEYNLLGSTTHISGTITRLQSKDSNYMDFRSYFSGVSMLDFVDNNASDIDSSTSKGTHSNFFAQQAGPDMIYDVLTEEDTDTASNNTYNYELDLEVQWKNSDHNETNGELAVYVKKGANTHSVDAAGGYMMIGDGTADWGSTTGTISFWIRMDDSVQGRFWGQDGNMETRWSGTNLMLDWGATASMTSAYSFSPDTWYFVAIVWDENNNNLFLYVGDENNPPTLDVNSLNGTWTSTTPAPTENRFMNGVGGNEPVDGQGDDLRYWNISRSLHEIQSDYNTELTGSETNLKSYFKLNNNFDDIGPDNNDGTGSGTYSFSSNVPFEAPPAESLRIDVWHDDSWQILLTDLFVGWNNVSISSYLDSQTFTVRFKGGTETGDNVQDRWLVDVMLLHVWSNEYTAEVEVSGSSDTEKWGQLNWSVVSAWTTDLVNVTLQLYNYSLGDYSTSGNGYISYTSSLADSDEVKSQTVEINPEGFRNSSGSWRMKIRGVKSTTSLFDLKVDVIRYEVLNAPPPNLAVIGITCSSTSIYAGNIVAINVTVENDGGTTETFNLTTYCNNTPIGTQMVLHLVPQTNTTLTYKWNTTETPLGKYTIKAVADIVLGEIATVDNTYIDGSITVHTQTPQPFTWGITVLYALVVLGILFPLAIVIKRKKKKEKSAPSAQTFSEQFGMTHNEIIGKKMLLQIDPTSDYHKALLTFVYEAKNNDELVFIFTSLNSVLHKKFSGSKDVKLFLSTSKTSSLQKISDMEILTPANDLSVLLDAFAKAQKAEKNKPINILFDNISDTILMCGFEKTYKFLRFLVETVSSEKVAALFMFNPTAHDPATASSIRGLFHVQLDYSKSRKKQDFKELFKVSD